MYGLVIHLMWRCSQLPSVTGQCCLDALCGMTRQRALSDTDGACIRPTPQHSVVVWEAPVMTHHLCVRESAVLINYHMWKAPKPPKKGRVRCHSHGRGLGQTRHVGCSAEAEGTCRKRQSCLASRAEARGGCRRLLMTPRHAVPVADMGIRQI